MDKLHYAQKALHKLEVYSKAGWILGRNLFITYEMENMPFSFNEAKSKLAEILALDRVIW